MIELRIKEVLKEKGMTAKSLSEKMNKAPQYINNIINGGKGASLNTLSEIASVLNVPVSSLFADYKSSSTIPSSETAIKCPKCGEKIKIKVE